MGRRQHILEPAAQEIAAATSRLPSLDELGPDGARKALDDIQAAPIAAPEVDERWITVAAEVGEVRVRIVKPVGSAAPLPSVLYIHGGGWVRGNAATHDRLVSRVGCRRERRGGVRGIPTLTGGALSGRHRTGLCHRPMDHPRRRRRGARHVAAGRRRRLGRRQHGRCRGDSGQTARRRDLRAPVAVLPGHRCRAGHRQLPRVRRRPVPDRQGHGWYWDAYLPEHDRRAEITASPLRASIDDLAGLPEALVIVEENDVLRDEGEAYARRHTEAGVRTASVRYNGTIHEFMLLNPLRGTAAATAAIEQAIHVLRQVFAMRS